MRWLPVETWRWETPLTVAEIRERLAGCSRGPGGMGAQRKADFVGTTSETGFELTPVVWGQMSFLPRIIGRWQSGSDTTRLQVDVVPNTAVQFCLVMLFAFLGILVYDANLQRVATITGGTMALAWLWMQVAHLSGAVVAERKLIRLLKTVPVTVPNDGAELASVAAPGQRKGTVASRLAMVTVVAGGASLWLLIYFGKFALTRRPAVDLVSVYLGTQALAAVWFFWISELSARARVRWLALLFAVEVGWTWCVVVDGYAGDGRPILAWRWSPKHAVALIAASTPSTDTVGNVDLSVIGPHDFAEFRGPRRDGVVTGLRLNPDWETSPPRIVWQRPVGLGWSAFAVAGEFAVTQEQRGTEEAVVCYDLATGEPCWEHHDPGLFEEMMGGNGPRATPTIHEGRVYALGATGTLNCLEGQDGLAVWSVNVVTENHAPPSLFGMSGGPLIWHDLVIVAPGGPGASLVAYDRPTGRRVWGAGDAAAAYAAPQLATLGGVEQVLCFNAEGLFAHAPADGRILWSIPWVTPPERNNVCQPVVWIDEAGRETVFVASGYGKGCGLFDVTRAGAEWAVAEQWRNNRLQAKFTSVVEREGYVYGLDNNILCCIDLRTGRRCWKGGRYGFGQVLLVDRHVLVVSEEGELVLCDAMPDGHREAARFAVLHGRTWTHPALAGQRLLIRNDRLAACVELPVLAFSDDE